MNGVTLPETIFEDAAFVHYRRGYRAARLVVHQNIMRQCHQTRTCRMRLCAWALNWGRSVNQIKAIYAQMAADGLCTWTIEGEGHRDDFATFSWLDAFVSAEETAGDAVDLAALKEGAYKAGYEAGRRSKARGEAEETTPEPQPTHATPTDDPQTTHTETTRGNGTHAGAQPVTGNRTVQPESVLIKTPEPVTGPEPDGLPEEGLGEAPVNIVEAFVRLGMEPQKAEERVQEFGRERCRDALETLAYRMETKAVPNRVGFLVDFLVNKRATPEAVVRRRERAKQVRPPQAPAVSPSPAPLPRGESCLVKPPMEAIRAKLSRQN